MLSVSGAFLAISVSKEQEIIRLSPQDDIATQFPIGVGRGLMLNRQRHFYPRVEEGSEKYDEKKNSLRAPDYLIFGCCCPAQAQQPKKVPRIGYLSKADPATESARSEAIRLALRELGYIEGQNIAIEYRYAEGKLDRFPELAAELVRLKVDIIVDRRGPADPGGQECDQDDSHRYGGRWARSCRGRPG